MVVSTAPSLLSLSSSSSSSSSASSPSEQKTPSAAAPRHAAAAASTISADEPSAIAVSPEARAAAADADAAALLRRIVAGRRGGPAQLVCAVSLIEDGDSGGGTEFVSSTFPGELVGLLPNVEWAARARALNAELQTRCCRRWRRHPLRDASGAVRAVMYSAGSVALIGAVVFGLWRDGSAAARAAGAIVLGLVGGVMVALGRGAHFVAAEVVERHAARWNAEDVVGRRLRWQSVRVEAATRDEDDPVWVSLLGLFVPRAWLRHGDGGAAASWTIECEQLSGDAMFGASAASAASEVGAEGSVGLAAAAPGGVDAQLPQYTPRPTAADAVSEIVLLAATGAESPAAWDSPTAAAAVGRGRRPRAWTTGALSAVSARAAAATGWGRGGGARGGVGGDEELGWGIGNGGGSSSGGSVIGLGVVVVVPDVVGDAAEGEAAVETGPPPPAYDAAEAA